MIIIFKLKFPRMACINTILLSEELQKITEIYSYNNFQLISEILTNFWSDDSEKKRQNCTPSL